MLTAVKGNIHGILQRKEQIQLRSTEDRKWERWTF